MNPKENTAIMRLGVCCKVCGWPVIDVCCNYEFTTFKNADEFDYWCYCSNKGCKNHDGEGYLQRTPEWINTTHKHKNPEFDKRPDMTTDKNA